MSTNEIEKTTPSALMSIVNAARASGDRDLERAAKKLLREKHGIKIVFRQSSQRVERGRS